MKLGVNAWLWLTPITTDDLLKVIAKVSVLGFDCIEIPLEQVGTLDVPRIAAALQDHELGSTVCVAMSPERDLIHPDEVVRDSTMTYLRHCIDTAHALGARHVVGPMYSSVGRLWQQSGEARARDLDSLAGYLRNLAAYAEEQGVTLCVEPLNRFETSFMNLASQVVALLGQIDSPACKLLLDTFHMNIEEVSSAAAIRLAGAHLAQLHVCANDRGAPGSGHIDWAGIMTALRDINFQGTLVIEAFHTDNKTMAAAASIWQSRAPTADELAKRGLEFLRQLS